MGAFVSTDVTVTLVKKNLVGTSKLNHVTMAFGDGALTYPALGIPFGALSRLGLYSALELAQVEQPHGDGYVYKIDKGNRKIRIYQAANDLLFIGGITATEPVAIASADTLGKNAATNRTIAASASATKGGVIPGPLVEVDTGFAPAATTLNMLVYGR